MSKYHVKADRKLFDEWRVLGGVVGMMSAIAQNDLVLDEADLADFRAQVASVKLSIDALAERSLANFVEAEPHIQPDGSSAQSAPAPGLW